MNTELQWSSKYEAESFGFKYKIRKCDGLKTPAIQKQYMLRNKPLTLDDLNYYIAEVNGFIDPRHLNFEGAKAACQAHHDAICKFVVEEEELVAAKTQVDYLTRKYHEARAKID